MSGPRVRVQETRVLATQLASEWWTAFSHHHSRIGRLTIVSHSIGGAVVDVACDDEEHAHWLVAHMQEQGIPKAALKVVHGDKVAA